MKRINIALDNTSIIVDHRSISGFIYTPRLRLFGNGMISYNTYFMIDSPFYVGLKFRIGSFSVVHRMIK